jgi:hypothetical protein
MPKCAFCHDEAKLSGEHVWSDWMNRVLPAIPYQFTRENETGEPDRWKTRSLNQKLPVVCENCNNGWMSDLENLHARPAMKDLITSDKGTLLSPERLRSIAIFAFKSAVIVDHALVPNPKFRDREPFFSADSRTAFRQSLVIPAGVQMWLGAFKEEGHGILRALYHASPPEVEHGFESYVLTYGVGFVLFQVVVTRWLGIGVPGFRPSVRQSRVWNKFTLPLWPSDGRSALWPPDKQFTLRTVSQFSRRWGGANIRF